MSTLNYMLGKTVEEWRSEEGKQITFCVTEDCNLACKYCYIVGKNHKNKMTFDVAKKAVDYILSHPEDFPEKAVIWDFIGGEPFLEIDLIDKICDYIKIQMYQLDHLWFNNYRFNFSSNGLLYHTPKVQRFIKKNHSKLNIGISVDGNKTKHDLQRVFPDGSGSYDLVKNNISLWQKQFPNSHTKATFSHDDLPHLKDSIISLWDLGINDVSANVIFEDVWEEGDDQIFENQLKELADYILEHDLWKDHNVRFFEENLGKPLDEEKLNQNFCGVGKMLAIDYKGDFFPCVRFVDYSLSNRPGYSIGNIHTGIDKNRLRPFMLLNLQNQSKEECINCEVATGCAWCVGHNYDTASTDTIFQRATFICKMHKANCNANDYFWYEFEKRTGIKPTVTVPDGKEKYLMFLESDHITTHCSYKSKIRLESKYMAEETYKLGLEFCEKHKLTPILLGDFPYADASILRMSKTNYHNDNKFIQIFDNDIYQIQRKIDKNNNNQLCILKINKGNIPNIERFIKVLKLDFNRINLILDDIELWKKENLENYERELSKLSTLIIESYKEGRPLEINVLTDILELDKMCNCGAGENTFTLAPNGRIYMCPAFYFEDPEKYMCNLDLDTKLQTNELVGLEQSPLCKGCDAFHCSRCKYLNHKLTTQINVPSEIQCIISHIERECSVQIKNCLEKEGIIFRNALKSIDYLDPIHNFYKTKSKQLINQ